MKPSILGTLRRTCGSPPLPGEQGPTTPLAVGQIQASRTLTQFASLVASKGGSWPEEALGLQACSGLFHCPRCGGIQS
jgi:hypothetical protein